MRKNKFKFILKLTTFKIGEFHKNILQFYLSSSSIDSSMKFVLRRKVEFNFVKIFVLIMENVDNGEILPKIFGETKHTDR